MKLNIIPARDGPPRLPCKGRLFRFKESCYEGTRGRVVFSKELRPLKSLSCAGCEECWAFDEDLRYAREMSPRGYIQFDVSLEPEDTVHLTLVEGPRDPDTGALESWHYLVQAVPPQHPDVTEEDLE